MRLSLLIVLLLACGALLACGSDEDGEATGSEAPAAASNEDASSAPAEGQAYDPGDAASKSLISEIKGVPKPPAFELPPGPPPKEVTIRDLRKGKGAKIEKGDFFSASYIALNYDKPPGEQLEDHWTSGPFNWYWEDEALTEGWELGLAGMRVGGLRELLVPSKLAYGDGDRAYLIELLSLER